MNRYASLSDDFYLNLNLNTEMELSSGRESVLHFAEQMQKRYPEMRNFYAREKNDFVLEGDKDQGTYRWCSIEPRRIASGHVNPPDMQTALEQHRKVLELAPYELSVSPLDCEALDLLVGFDFSCRGNHNQVVTEALGVCPAYERFASLPGATVVTHEPSLTLAIDDECRVQVRVSVETRTSPYHIRTGDYQEDQLSVYVTARRYGSLDPGATFVGTLDQLAKACFEVLDTYVVDAVLQPLARAISLE